MQFFFRRIRRRLRVTYWSSICVIRNIKKTKWLLNVAMISLPLGKTVEVMIHMSNVMFEQFANETQEYLQSNYAERCDIAYIKFFIILNVNNA